MQSSKWRADFLKTRPDKEKDLRGWNKSWEMDLSKHWDADIFASTDSQLIADAKVQNMMRVNKQQLLFTSERKMGEVCKLQEDIRSTALRHLAAEGLEESWKSLTADSCGELILKALYTVSSAGPDMEGYRKWCPEMTVSNLSKNDGHLFFKLLKIVITDDPDATKIPLVKFPNHKVDWFLGHPSMIMLKPRFIVDRAYFISFAIWRILLALSGGPEEEYLIGKSPRASNYDQKTKLTKQVGGDKTLTTLIKSISKEYKVNRLLQVDACWNCGKDVAHLPPGTQLKACVKCKEVGRIVRYCSRECQKTDWKEGIPHPHKSICGKPLVEEDDSEAVGTTKLNESTEPQNLLIPDPDPGFKRSPALLYQISQLREKKDMDYMIFQSGNLPDYGFGLPSDLFDKLLHLRLAFLILRRRAFRSGDKDAVQRMFAILTMGFFQNKVSSSHIAMQLEREYGFSLRTTAESKGVSEKADFTDEEKEWAEYALMGVQRQPVSLMDMD